MTKIIFVLLIAVGVIWNAFGAFYYLRINKEVRSRCKKVILAIVCGPLTWMCVSFEVMFNYIDSIASDKVMKKFEAWLLK